MRRRSGVLVLGTVTALMCTPVPGSAAPTNLSSPTADARTGEDRGWGPVSPFIHRTQEIQDSLMVEVASDQRAIATFDFDAIEEPCSTTSTRLMSPAGEWSKRQEFEALEGRGQLLVADQRLAVLSRTCGGDVELRYTDRALWGSPAVLDTYATPPVVGGMNRGGLVAVARETDLSDRWKLEVDVARPGSGWTRLPRVGTGDGDLVVDHVAVTKREEVVVVWHVDARFTVSTYRDGSWASVGVPRDGATSGVSVASNRKGFVAIVRLLEDAVVLSFRQPDGSVSEPEIGPVSAGCTYVGCVSAGLDQHGNLALAWVGPSRPLIFGRRDVSTGAWTSERTQAGSRTPIRFDVHADGTAVIHDREDQRLYVCAGADPCAGYDYPQEPRPTDSASFAAGGGGTVVGIAGRSDCDDWCEFEHLGGAVLS